MNPENNLTNPTPNPATPAPQPPVAQPAAPVAPAPAAPVTPIASATPVAPAQPASTQPPAPGTPGSPTTLGVAMVTPTHFDDQNTVHPIVGTPAVPDPNQPVTPDKPTKPKATPEQMAKRLSILSIVLGAVAVVFLGLGIWGIIFGISSNDKLSQTNKDLELKNSIVASLEESVCAGEDDSICPIDSPEKVPVYKTTQGYIYITEWNIKLKIPDDLTSVSYILDQKYRPSICFNAVKKGVQYFPAFADVAQNPGGMGCLTRVATTEGNTAAETGMSFGEKTFTYKEYSYFYTAPAKVFSTDPAEQGLEATAVQIIKNMIKDNISQYE